MLSSMTGFGQDGQVANGYLIQVELKSVNHRYSEIVVRMPREWNSLEESLRKAIQQHIKRGRVEAVITIERESGASQSVQVNWPLLEAYQEAARQLKERYSLSDSLSLQDMLLLPDILSFKKTSQHSDDRLDTTLLDCMNHALLRLRQMREAEGQHLYEDLSERLHKLDKILEAMVRISPLVVAEYRSKLRCRLEDMLADTVAFHEHRFTMEIALLAERSNIDEELTRLQSHFQQSRLLMEQDEPVGRKLDFLIQEMNREVNTIGSKANHTELINLVVEMKAELEKIREQVQNLE